MRAGGSVLAGGGCDTRGRGVTSDSLRPEGEGGSGAVAWSGNAGDLACLSSLVVIASLRSAVLVTAVLWDAPQNRRASEPDLLLSTPSPGGRAPGR